MRFAVTMLVLAAIAVAGPAEARRKPAGVSWAKAGVSFEDYRRDTLECANQTYGLEVSMKAETAEALAGQNATALAAFVGGPDAAGSGQGAYRNGAEGYRAAMTAIDPKLVAYRNSNYEGMFRNAAYVDVADQLQAVLDYCLTSRGYRKIKLTADQRRQLRRLAKGSEARVRFLHALSAAG